MTFDHALGHIRVFYDGEVITAPLSEHNNLKSSRMSKFITSGRTFRIETLESLFDSVKTPRMLNQDPREEILVYKYERT